MKKYTLFIAMMCMGIVAYAQEKIYSIVTDIIEVAADELIEKANKAGGLDNITVIIVLNKNT